MNTPSVERSKSNTREILVPRPLRKFGRLLDASEQVFRHGKTLVCSDPKLARDVLAFRPDVFEDKALLGEGFKSVKGSRAEFRAMSTDLSTGIKTERWAESLLEASKKWPAPACFIVAALDLFGPAVVGKQFSTLRSDAIEFVIAGVDRHKWANRTSRRKRLNESFFTRLEGLFEEWDEPGTLAEAVKAAASQTQSQRESAMLIAAGLMSVSAPPGFAAAWMAYETREGGALPVTTLEASNPLHVAFETLRLRPPAWNHGRKVIGRGELGNNSLEPGMEVLVPVGHIQTTESLWPNALQFTPDRWVDLNHASAPFFPFGLGRRSCVGGALGTEILVATARILTSELTVGTPRGPCRIGPLYGPPNFRVTARR